MGAGIGATPLAGGAIGDKPLGGIAIGDTIAWTAPVATQTVNLLGNVTPANPADQDVQTVEVGMRFTVTQAGNVTGARFYKGAGNGGTHVGYLYAGTARVGTVTFTGETATGWQQALFTTPIAVTVGTTYTVTYVAPQGRYAGDGGYPWPKTANGITGLGSVYRYGTGTTAPTTTFGSSNYYVDITAQLAGDIPVDPPPVDPPPTGNGPSPAYWSTWSNGPSTADTWFPIGAWNANVLETSTVTRYPDLGAGLKDTGVNLLVATWTWLTSIGPTYLERAKTLGLKALPGGPDMAYLTRNPGHASTIIGWQMGDEFDMFRSNDPGPRGPNSPTQINNDYKAAKVTDPTRPQHINWGKAVGGNDGKYYWLNAIGGYDTGSALGDMKLYVESSEMLSVDYYWWTDPWEQKPNAYRYGEAIDSMRRYSRLSRNDRPMWGFVENSRAWDNSQAIAPDRMESAIWSCIVHGARGIVYFIHDFGQGTGTGGVGVYGANYYDRAGGDAILARMKSVNARLAGLAPVLNSPEVGAIDNLGREKQTVVTVSSTNSIPVDVMVRRYGGQTYVFAQASGDDAHLLSGNTTATFTMSGSGSGVTTVRDEGRTVSRSNDVWSDTFTPYQMHIYVL